MGCFELERHKNRIIVDWILGIPAVNSNNEWTSILQRDCRGRANIYSKQAKAQAPCFKSLRPLVICLTVVPALIKRFRQQGEVYNIQKIVSSIYKVQNPKYWFWLMGTSKEDQKYEANQEYSEKIVKTYIICLWSFLVSLAGALLLLWWDYEHHPTNSQLWMVPFGLILFVTPVIAWFAAVVSETCNYKVDEDDDNSQKTSEVV
ncbi:unnamed protein product [Dovyalis caffra]|uniref:Uncharacterized protein n=1 Tax=Dovyalis caffra TaxID=77055 RepID=A0AAV1SE27_9ROSI|nr:unnamed protein product [Dovyalis caffra]